MARSSAFLLFIGSIVSSVLGQTGLAPKQYLSLALGSIKPTGWLYDQLMVQTNGLAGHEHEFYDYHSRPRCDEAFLKPTGWLLTFQIGGPSYYSDLEEAGSYWFNAMVPNGILVNNSGIIQRTQEFLDYVLAHQDSTGWMGPEVNTTKPRYLWGRYPFMFGAIQMVEYNPELADQVVSALYKFVSLANTMLHNNGEGVEELYDFYPNGNEDLLLDTMKQLKYTGVPWEEVFESQWHGVNMAEGLKALPATYRFTHNQTDLDRASEGWDLLFQYHGRPSGIYAADEYLAGLEAVRGTELCLVVETMFSGSYLYQVIGDPKYVDRVERIAYNALPAELTGDFWSRQYLQQQNQIAAKNMSPDPFATDGPYSNVFGLEPNYPCCTVYLGPFQTTATLAEENPVTVTVDSIYPFSDLLNTTITAAKAFTYYIRIPSWTVNGTITINRWYSDPSFAYEWPSSKSRPHGSIAVHRGPLHYALDKQPLAKDLEFDATAAWQYAIDPSTLQFTNNPPKAGILPSPIFDSGLAPLSMTVTACPINWPEAGNTFVASPPTNPECTGAQKTITLTPYGARDQATHWRVPDLYCKVRILTNQ
ncbi:hypothetical protein BT96DRAFT_934810 [Gymnopus androsaceus JB14]|uniref:DUF1680-domain-containing protein n=1 Tax=Gymnopus androsaceus JB14 TaxID=1447944 RepID=A0A6A4I4X0_9AGAR|nr:hypothetical protein BT96DRAFT_934810 [Gymnopus androsaceus JB14]